MRKEPVFRQADRELRYMGYINDDYQSEGKIIWDFWPMNI